MASRDKLDKESSKLDSKNDRRLKGISKAVGKLSEYTALREDFDPEDLNNLNSGVSKVEQHGIDSDEIRNHIHNAETSKTKEAYHANVSAAHDAISDALSRKDPRASKFHSDLAAKHEELSENRLDEKLEIKDSDHPAVGDMIRHLKNANTAFRVAAKKNPG
jgi:hypothetical protein